MRARTLIKRNAYYDSVALMRLSASLSKLDGIRDAAAIMGTDTNKELLRNSGLLTDQAMSAHPNDLVVIVRGEDEASLDHALEAMDSGLLKKDGKGKQGGTLPRSLMEALSQQPTSNVVLVSVPGPYAATEAYRALMEGMHVFLFSDNVGIEDEVMLKDLALERGLLMMGPGCGTAIINGKPLGFANSIRRGPIGIVAAAGTGLQEVSSLIHRFGSGVSQAIGVGGRDLSDEVGGKMMCHAFKALAEDLDTHVIVLISKPPSRSVEQHVLEQAHCCPKKVIVSFLGATLDDVGAQGPVPASTLEDAAWKAVASVAQSNPQPIWPGARPEDTGPVVSEQTSKMTDQQQWVRGLFSGGTLCAEAQVILGEMIGESYSNVPLRPEWKLGGVDHSGKHCMIDLGTDEYTAGIPHPMIDLRTRREAIRREVEDPELAILLLDFVLGFGAHEDPAGELIPVLLEAKDKAMRRGGCLAVIASVCGTDEDVQCRQRQVERLEDAGVIVMGSNAQAARLAGLIVAHQTRRRGAN